MSRTIKIALIQQHATKDKNDNLSRAVVAFEEAAKNGAKLIAFPELSFSYFYPQHPSQAENLKFAESIPGPTTGIFSELAKKWNVVTVINLLEKDGSHTYDSSPVFGADGTLLGVTRMVHIYEGECFHEKGYYAPGDGQNIVFQTAVGRIGICICYDRHYPEYMRALALKAAELVIVPQAGAVGEWPPGLFEAEVQVAGFQNGYFVALCNRVGKEDCVNFEGKSFITAPDGRICTQAPAEQDAILFHEIDLDEVKNCHGKKHFLVDRCPAVYNSWFNY